MKNIRGALFLLSLSIILLFNSTTIAQSKAPTIWVCSPEYYTSSYQLIKFKSLKLWNLEMERTRGPSLFDYKAGIRSRADEIKKWETKILNEKNCKNKIEKQSYKRLYGKIRNDFESKKVYEERNFRDSWVRTSDGSFGMVRGPSLFAYYAKNIDKDTLAKLSKKYNEYPLKNLASTTQTQQVAESTLPDCKGIANSNWTNCIGTYTSISGSKYVGEFKNGIRHGQGTATETDGTKYVGEFKNGIRHGQGSVTETDGTKYVGGWKDGKYNGQGSVTETDGTKYVGGWKDGKYNGQGTYTSISGSKYVGEFKDGTRHGQGTFTWSDGRKAIGIWKNGEFIKDDKTQIAKKKPTQTQQVAKEEEASWVSKVQKWYFGKKESQTQPLPKKKPTQTQVAKEEPLDVEEMLGQTQQVAESAFPDCKGSKSSKWTNCHGTETYAGGTKYVGEFKYGEWHGQGTITYSDGEKYVGEWKDGKRHGQGTNTWSNGNKYVGEWKDGKRHGQGTNTWTSGKFAGDKYVGEWKYALEHGQGTKIFADGRKAIGIWENGEFVKGDKTQIAKKKPTQTQQVAKKKKKKIKLFNFGREKKTITMEEVVLLGKYEKFNSYPEGMLKEFKTCNKQFCRGKKAGKRVYEIFVMRSPLWHERHPGDMIHGMAWFEIMYLEKLRKTQKQIERYTKNGPEGYSSNSKMQIDVKTLHALIKTNKGRIKMREALGLSAKDDLATVLRRHWLLGDLLNNDTYKVKKVSLNKDLKIRKKLLEKYQASLKKYKEKLEKENKK